MKGKGGPDVLFAIPFNVQRARAIPFNEQARGARMVPVRFRLNSFLCAQMLKGVET